MQNAKKRKWGGWIAAVLFIWFIMNVRVAAGIGSTFERAVDGLVGIGLLVAVVFLAMDFLQDTGRKKQ